MSAVVSRPGVRPMVGRRSAAPRRRDDLLGRVHLAVRLARRTLKAAVAAEEECLGKGRPDRPAALVLGKVVGEAAMLLRTTAPLRGEDETLDVEARLLAVQLVAQARGARVRERLCNDAGGALTHASAHLFLGDAGYPDEAFDRLLGDILEGNEVCGPERLPNHQLEGAWLDQIRRGRVDVEPIDEALLMSTCIDWPLDVLGCSTLDLYMFTHVVMYASDMGRRPVHLRRPVAEIVAEAEAGLAAALDADNFDLAAELLWTWPMLRQPWSPVAGFAFDVLAKVQDAQAFLPGPEYLRWAQQPGHGLAHEEVVLRTSYHANLVMGMLCAVALQSGLAPPSSLPMAEKSLDMGLRSDVDVLDSLPTRSFVPQWQQDFVALSGSERSALSSLCFSVWFRRAAAAGDVAGLRDALAATLEHDDSDGPSAHQALKRLQRVTAIARLSPRLSCVPARPGSRA